MAVDDGSTDRSLEVLRAQPRRSIRRCACWPWRRTAARPRRSMRPGARARGRMVVSLDADLQNDPADIPAMVRKLGRDARPTWSSACA